MAGSKHYCHTRRPRADPDHYDPDWDDFQALPSPYSRDVIEEYGSEWSGLYDHRGDPIYYYFDIEPIGFDLTPQGEEEE